MSELLNGFNNGRDTTEGIGGQKRIDQIANGVITGAEQCNLPVVMPRFSKLLREKKKRIKNDLQENYGINTSNRWLDKYIFFFSKCIYPLENISTTDAIDFIDNDIDKFAYFIYGMRVNSNGA